MISLIIPRQSSANAQNNNWQLWREKGDLSVSYQAIEDSPLITIKASTKITSTLASALAFIQNTHNTANWLANAKNSQVLNQLTPQRRIFITRFKGLWPVKPRFMLLTSHYWQNYDLSIEISINNATEKELQLITPLDEGDVIQVDVIQAHWLIKPIAQHQLSIDYVFTADAKGNLPRSFTNKLSLRAIWQTFDQLNQQLPLTNNQQQTIAGIKEATH
ncbi:hypothetical protein [Thalassotalea sp. PLHSN55]|uniref:hypothetical protein n=1 Tax=Thalassotalea sp. PLHSN55 TaxID=3435888 RepID=UPI003F82BE19